MGQDGQLGLLTSTASVQGRPSRVNTPNSPHSSSTCPGKATHLCADQASKALTNQKGPRAPATPSPAQNSPWTLAATAINVTSVSEYSTWPIQFPESETGRVCSRS